MRNSGDQSREADFRDLLFDLCLSVVIRREISQPNSEAAILVQKFNLPSYGSGKLINLHIDPNGPLEDAF